MSAVILHLLTILVVSEIIISGLSELNYIWPEYNDRYDCIVGIAVDNDSVSVGVFISTRNVLTSANPLNHIEKDTERVRVHVIKVVYNESEAIKIEKIDKNQSNRNKSWIPMGIEGTEHTSIHDIAIITVSQQIRQIPKVTLLREKSRSSLEVVRHMFFFSKPYLARRPYAISLPNITAYQRPTEFFFAAFGYLDEEHVQNNTFLEVSFSSDLVVNCDEWIPREWGLFICILDDKNSYSLASGAPLFEEGIIDTVYGVGCFSLKKGKENLHVFTDLKPYGNMLDGYVEDPENVTKRI